MAGEVFGPYRLVELLGRGGMGEVWRAHDTRAERDVALKVMGAWLGADPDFGRRFRRESALAGRLNAPNIVPIHQVGEIDGRLFIEMPLIDGRDLGELIAEQGPLPVERAVGVVSQVGRALSAAHRAGLVHRDVKPSNILVTDADGDDHVYLIDFGIARAVDGSRISLSGAAVGTPAYMAPERFAGRGDHRGDVYALGCVLHEVLTRSAPYAGSDPLVLMNAHLNAAPPCPSALCPTVPASLDEVVTRALAKDPDQRYGSAAEFVTAARDALVVAADAPARRARPDHATSAAAGPQDAPTPTADRGRETVMTAPSTPTSSEPAAAAASPTGPRPPAAPAGPPVDTRARRSTMTDPASTADPAGPRRAPEPADQQPPFHSPSVAERPVGESPPTLLQPPAATGRDSPRRRRRLAWVTTTVALLAIIGLVSYLAIPDTPPLDLTLVGHTSTVSAVATGELDGRPVVVSGSYDTTIRVWDQDTGALLGSPITGHTNSVNTVATAQLDGRPVIITGGNDNTVRVWDLATHDPVGAPIIDHLGYVSAVTTAELDGRPVIVSGGYDDTVRVWDLATHAPIGAPIRVNTGAVVTVATSMLDGRPVIVSGSADKAVWVWDLATHVPVGAPITSSVQAVTTAELDGRPVIVSGGDDDTVRVWDLATRARVGAPITGHTDSVLAVGTTWLAGQPVIVSASADKTVRMWDLTTHAPVGTPITSSSGAVTAVATTQLDGQPVIAFGSADKTIHVRQLT